MLTRNRAIFIYFLILLFICSMLADKYDLINKYNYQEVLAPAGQMWEGLAEQMPDVDWQSFKPRDISGSLKEKLKSWFAINAATGKFLLGQGLPVSVQPFNGSQFFLLATHPYQLLERVFSGVFVLGLRPTNVYLGNEMPVISYISPEVIISRDHWDVGNIEVVVTEPTENYPPELENPDMSYSIPDDLQQSEIEVDYHLSSSQQEQRPINSRIEQERQDLPSGERERERQVSKPRVLIYHSHASETYRLDTRPMDKNGHIIPPGSARGQIVAVGSYLKAELEKKGIPVLQLTDIFDTTYREAYLQSREAVQKVLGSNSQLEMVFDIHRDALDNPSKEELTVEIQGREAARIMILVTLGSFGLPHPNWEQNYYFAKKLAQTIQEMYPGLLRRIEVRRQMRYNQDLSPNALLLEFGGFQNTLAEARYSAQLLSNVLVKMLNE